MVTLRNFFLSVSFIVSVQVRIFPLNMLYIIIYVAQWWEKCLSKRSLIKHTCSWRDKLIALRTLKRQAKIFLRISKMEMLDVWLISEYTFDTSCLDLTRPSKIILVYFAVSSFYPVFHSSLWHFLVSMFSNSPVFWCYQTKNIGFHNVKDRDGGYIHPFWW